MPHPIKDILESNGYKLVDSGQFWKTTALYRGGRNPTSLSIDKQTGYFWDFSAGAKGKPEELIKLIGGGAVDFSGYVAEETVKKLSVPKFYSPEILKTFLPDYGFFPSRGISEATLKTFQAGMCHSGKLRKRICFPVYNRDSKIIGFSGRWFQETVPTGYEFNIPKWKHLSSSKSYLFGCHLNYDLIKGKRIALVESIGDMLALWEAGIYYGLPIFGTTLSTVQLNYIISLSPKQILICTNNDNSDGFSLKSDKKGPEAARRAQKKLTLFFNPDNITIALPPKNDFGDMSSAEIREFFCNL